MLTIQQARELLGDDAIGMTDVQLADTVAVLDVIADMVLDCYVERSKRIIPQRDEDAA